MITGESYRVALLPCLLITVDISLVIWHRKAIKPWKVAEHRKEDIVWYPPHVGYEEMTLCSLMATQTGARAHHPLEL
jgi:hypothetical protein